MSDPKTWFITGASSGFGKAIAEKAIREGDSVVITSRNEADLKSLVALAPDQVTAFSLDMTQSDQINQIVHDALLWQGKIDILVNNAGRGEVGSAENTPDAWLREMFDLHVFGPAILVRAVLPNMRNRKSGTIVQISSYGGKVAMAGFSSYNASKSALEGYSEALADEVKPLGINVIIVQPGTFGTNFSANVKVASFDKDYEDTVGQTKKMVTTLGTDGQILPDPAIAAAQIYSAINSTEPPLHLVLEDDAMVGLGEHYRNGLAELEKQTQ